MNIGVGLNVLIVYDRMAEAFDFECKVEFGVIRDETCNESVQKVSQVVVSCSSLQFLNQVDALSCNLEEAVASQ